MGDYFEGRKEESNQQLSAYLPPGRRVGQPAVLPFREGVVAPTTGRYRFVRA